MTRLRHPQPSPYEGLRYPELREAHDRIYFGGWRGSSPTLADLQNAGVQLARFLDNLEQALDRDGPEDAREYLAKAHEAYAQAEPSTSPGSATLLAINNALSYGHRVLDIMLRHQGDLNHASRDFALYYDGFAPDGDQGD